MAPTDLDDMLAERARLGDLSWAAALSAPVVLDRDISQAALGWIMTGELDATDELIELGYIDDAHEPTSSGGWLRAVFSTDEVLTLRVFRKTADKQSAFFAGFDPRLAFIAVGENDVWRMGYYSLQELPDVIMRWLSIAPVWTFDVLSVPLSTEDFEAGVAGTLVAEPGTELAQMAAKPWTQFALQFGFSDALEFVEIDGWGLFVLDRSSETAVSLSPVVPGDFYVQLVSGLLQSVGVDDLPERVDNV